MSESCLKKMKPINDMRTCSFPEKYFSCVKYTRFKLSFFQETLLFKNNGKDNCSMQNDFSVCSSTFFVFFA